MPGSSPRLYRVMVSLPADVSDGAATRRTLFELMSVEFPTLQRWDAEPQPPSADTRWQEVQVQLVRPYLEAYRAIIAAILVSDDSAWLKLTTHTGAEVDLARHVFFYFCIVMPYSF